MWDAFAQVYSQELLQQQAARSSRELSREEKQQILADILVHAELQQPHYDSSTVAFVTEPHSDDASFRRIGKLLRAAKQERGLA